MAILRSTVVYVQKSLAERTVFAGQQLLQLIMVKLIDNLPSKPVRDLDEDAAAHLKVS